MSARNTRVVCLSCRVSHLDGFLEREVEGKKKKKKKKHVTLA